MLQIREPDKIKSLKKSTNNNLITMCWKKFEIVFLNHVGSWPIYYEFRSNEHIHQNPQSYCFDCWNCLHSHIDLYKVGSISCSCKSCSCIAWYIPTCGEPEEFQGKVEQCSGCSCPSFSIREKPVARGILGPGTVDFFKTRVW